MAIPARALPGGSSPWRGSALRALALTLCTVLAGAVCAQAPAPKPGAPLKLRIVGGLADVGQFTQWESPFWTRDLPRLSQGRYTADIVAFDRAGVPPTEMLRLMQMGVVPFGTTLMGPLTARHPQYTAPELAGLNGDMAALRSAVAAFRPYLARTLREEHGVELLAIYTYPPQTFFCKRPLKGLSDLKGRRVRVSSAPQADFVGALGAIPVNLPFNQVVASLQGGDTECAVTGTLPGNNLGLHKLSNYLYPLPLNWGLSFFGANTAAWNALPADLRALLQRELPKLETAIWSGAERDAIEGIACNTGQGDCSSGTPGHMTLLPVAPRDDVLRHQIFATVVLPAWIRRCGATCAEIWNETIGPVRHVPAASPLRAR